MFVLEVAPLTHIPRPHPQTLTYYASEALARGAIVVVRIRSRRVKAVVLATTPASSLKMALRRAAFELKPIESVYTREPLIAGTVLERALWLTRTYCSSFGTALKRVYPLQLIAKEPKRGAPSIPKGGGHSLFSSAALSIGDARWKRYEEVLYRAYKSGKSSIVVVPRRSDVSSIIRMYAHIFPAPPRYWSSSIAVAERKALWQRMRAGEQMIVIGTRSAIFAPLRNLGAIIIEEEESDHHRSWASKPYYDVRTIGRFRAGNEGVTLVLGARTPSIREWWYAGKPAFPDVQSPAPRVEVIDLRKEIKEGEPSPLSPVLRTRIHNTLMQGGRVLLFLNRRGYATFVFCRDCGYIVQCPNCEIPMAYHSLSSTLATRGMICHHCGERSRAPDICPNCKGHRIKFFGLGTEQVVEACRKLFPGVRTGRLDSDTASHPRAYKKIASAFETGAIRILVGTQLAFPEVGAADLAGVISLDASLHLPDYEQGERAWRIFDRVRSLARHTLLIQTYYPRHPLFEAFRENDPARYYEYELATRKELGYPPFTQLVKLVYTHRSDSRASQDASILADKLRRAALTLPHHAQPRILGPAPAFIPREKGLFHWHLLIKFTSTAGALPDPEAVQLRNAFLEYVPSTWTVEVDPISLL